MNSSIKSFSLVKQMKSADLTMGQKVSVVYHDIFNYPLRTEDLKKWKVSKLVAKEFTPGKVRISRVGDYFVFLGREKIIKKRVKVEKHTHAKMEIARKFSDIISLNPFINFIGLTGALSMNNASKDSDIDFLIITRARSLWFARAIVWATLKLIFAPIRKPGSKEEKDKLCLNIWLDEEALSWPKGQRNIFTAHEILQIKPLFDREGTFKRFTQENSWVGDFWKVPSSKKISTKNPQSTGAFKKLLSYCFYPINLLAFFVQWFYMSGKITREKISLSRALFHPNDMSEFVLKKLDKYEAPTSLHSGHHLPSASPGAKSSRSRKMSSHSSSLLSTRFSAKGDKH